jgi:hypothetical protein
MRTQHSGKLLIPILLLLLLLGGAGAGAHFSGLARRVPVLNRLYPKANSAATPQATKGNQKPATPPSQPPQKPPGAVTPKPRATIKDAALRTEVTREAKSLAAAQSRKQKAAAALVTSPPPTDRKFVRMARLLEVMEPEEAAAIAEKMLDPDLEPVISKMRERQAARLLAAMKPERAAAIAKAMTKQK